MTDNRFSFIVALYAFCSDHHSGQWSRGYRIMSRITSHYRPRNIPSCLTDLQRYAKKGEYEDSLEYYYQLRKKYQNKM